MSDSRAPVKFLIVDDKEENLVALEALLRRDGLEVLKARTGDEALELLLANDVALALLDVHMPDMDGFALAELMRGSERTRHVPIIFVTAAVQEQHRIFRGYDAGAVDFLFKPIEPRILKHKATTFFELYRQRQELAETLRLNEMFVAALGHDLRSPLHAIVMATTMITTGDVDATVRRHSERVLASGRRMVAMIDELQDLARARLGGGIAIERAPMDLWPVVKSMVAECASASPESRIETRQVGETSGQWDAGRVAQIVSNLVGNAINHGTPGAPIEVSVRGDGPSVSLVVRNVGVIRDDVRATLFDPFRRGVTPSKRTGLGLGLYIVHQIVLAHGGAIDVRSSEAEGTTFRVTLPRT